MSKTTERTPRAARAEAQARPDAPPPMTATVGSAGTGVEKTTCSCWKLFLMEDCREKRGLPRGRGFEVGGFGGRVPPAPLAAATTDAARAEAGRAHGARWRSRDAGIAAARRNAGAGAGKHQKRTVICSLVGLFLFFFTFQTENYPVT